MSWPKVSTIEIQANKGPLLRTQVLSQPDEVDVVRRRFETTACHGQFMLHLAIDEGETSGIVGNQIDEDHRCRVKVGAQPWNRIEQGIILRVFPFKGLRR